MKENKKLFFHCNKELKAQLIYLDTGCSEKFKFLLKINSIPLDPKQKGVKMMQNDEMKDDEGPSNTLEHFTELEQVLQMIDSMQGTDAPGFEKDFEKYTEVLSR